MDVIPRTNWRLGVTMAHSGGVVGHIVALPTPTGTVAAMIGETWFVQGFHRGPLPAGPTTNTTEAVSFLVR